MPELLSTPVLTELRRTTLALAGMLALGGLPAAVWAQDLPPALRACAAQSDPGQRLDCYDREMKRLSTPTARPASPPQATTPAQPATPAPAPVAAKAVPPTASPAAAPPHTAAWRKIFSGGTAAKVTARIVQLKRSPDAMIIHLDNGQVWRQIGYASGDLTLHTGDEVTIAKHLGSYWLSARYVSDMQVRQQPQ